MPVNVTVDINALGEVLLVRHQYGGHADPNRGPLAVLTAFKTALASGRRERPEDCCSIPNPPFRSRAVWFCRSNGRPLGEAARVICLFL